MPIIWQPCWPAPHFFRHTRPVSTLGSLCYLFLGQAGCPALQWQRLPRVHHSPFPFPPGYPDFTSSLAGGMALSPAQWTQWPITEVHASLATPFPRCSPREEELVIKDPNRSMHHWRVGLLKSQGPLLCFLSIACLPCGLGSWYVTKTWPIFSPTFPAPIG